MAASIACSQHARHCIHAQHRNTCDCNQFPQLHLCVRTNSAKCTPVVTRKVQCNSTCRCAVGKRGCSVMAITQSAACTLVTIHQPHCGSAIAFIERKRLQLDDAREDSWQARVRLRVSVVRDEVRLEQRCSDGGERMVTVSRICGGTAASGEHCAACTHHAPPWRRLHRLQ